MFGRQSLGLARAEAWSGDGCLALELVANWTLRRAIYVPQPTTTSTSSSKLERRRGYLRDHSGRGGRGSALAGRAAGTQQVYLARAALCALDSQYSQSTPVDIYGYRYSMWLSAFNY